MRSCWAPTTCSPSSSRTPTSSGLWASSVPTSLSAGTSVMTKPFAAAVAKPSYATPGGGPRTGKTQSGPVPTGSARESGGAEIMPSGSRAVPDR